MGYNKGGKKRPCPYIWKHAPHVWKPFRKPEVQCPGVGSGAH